MQAVHFDLVETGNQARVDLVVEAGDWEGAVVGEEWKDLNDSRLCDRQRPSRAPGCRDEGVRVVWWASALAGVVQALVARGAFGNEERRRKAGCWES